MKRRLMLVLHAHLPFVRHPEHPEFLEEDWLFEAMIETYAPIVDACARLAADRVPFRLTMTLSPTLCEMLSDELLMARFETRLRRVAAACRRRARAPFEAAAAEHLRLFTAARGRRLLPEFRALQDRGVLEIITTAATHAILPYVSRPEALRAQIAVAVANYRKHFGRAPRGFWLPECAYEPGLDAALAEHGLRYFFVDAHALESSPARTPAGPTAFARDPESSRQVWSAAEGYPGDPWYREFYRDEGWANGRGAGLKFHRITGAVPLDRKEPYDPSRARERVEEHARHFLECRRRGAPLMVSPYDAELFGHWWYEGPRFLEAGPRRRISL